MLLHTYKLQQLLRPNSTDDCRHATLKAESKSIKIRGGRNSTDMKLDLTAAADRSLGKAESDS